MQILGIHAIPADHVGDGSRDIDIEEILSGDLDRDLDIPPSSLLPDVEQFDRQLPDTLI